MWATNTSPVPKSSARKTKSNIVPLEKFLSNARDEFARKRKEVPDLLRQSKKLRAEANEITQRHLTRRAKDLINEADAYEAEAKIRDSMVREREYEQMIAPYLIAYHQRVEIDEYGEDPRNITVPGSGKRRETIDSYVQQYDATASRQTTLLNEYLMETSNEAPKLAINTRDECPLCKEQLLLVNAKAILTCPKCGYAVTYLDATMSSMSYSDDVEFSSFSYKRINHFNEWLQQVQAKENFEITTDVLDKVMEELSRQRIRDKALITPRKIREILKQLKLRKAYEHVAQITSRLTGIKPLRLPSEVEEMCRLMFIAVQPAFEKHCPKDRKNFLSYAYCLYKFFQLLGYDEFLDTFSLLKGRDKLARQDEIFQRICKELDWEFVPSV